ncbi:efflux RND transporter periplasmic adaptor subunit [Hyphobacterium sp. HN65]|uniref:Efflux RND transporter periplasmic adaptor subunit n=1 Tax=Hyphobacterium lacteum TaxID=3116575 RepID=A0ABU7LMH3_9PROT|nr:efflux RND transporter periplasmic adaptor subunit [Hyphobacterium sp. HN65]MEE2525092.1 efflux RND transporter periplasmic adaptor subunit [Hyphobacterium sp. HN65]
MRRAATLLVVAGVFIAMTAIVIFRTMTGDNAEEGGGWGGAVTVAAYTVEPSTFADIVEALGTARANETVTVTARVSDTISRVDFDSGQSVEAGDILVELTDTEEAASLAEARATLREARREFDRVDGLIERGIAPRQRLDEARAAVERAVARVNSIEAQLADRIIRAPFSGLVGLREVSVGSLVRPGDPIITLDDTSIIKLDFSVPERFIAALESGLEIAARTSAYPDEIFFGQIAQIDSRIDPITRTVAVRAEINNEDSRLRPGQLMTVEIRRDQRNSPSIPGSAITRYLDTSYVFVIEETGNGTSVRQQTVELGRRNGNYVEVRDGLEIGDMIVAEGVHRVRDRMPVVISERWPARAGTMMNAGNVSSLTSQP